MPKAASHDGKTVGFGRSYSIHESVQVYLSGGKGFPPEMCPPHCNRSKFPPITPTPMREEEFPVKVSVTPVTGVSAHRRKK
jgi:hypothetical protein